MYTSSPNGTAAYATSTYGVGVRAATTSGDGVSAAATDGTAVYANATTGYGIYTASDSNASIVASSNSYYAIDAASSEYPAVLGTTLSNGSAAGLEGVDGTANGGTDDGVLGVTTNGNYGVEGDAKNGASGGVLCNSSGGIGVEGQGYEALYGSSDSFPLVLTDGSGNEELYVEKTGDIYANGSYNTFVHTRNGDRAIAYTPHSTISTLEDSGTAEVTGGTATVRFDPTFAAAIDTHTVYQVFLTPGGETHGLFVARKTPAGFGVREMEGARGTLSFDYRIVAATSGHTGDRMALVSATSVHEPRALLRKRARPSPKAFLLPTRRGAK